MCLGLALAAGGCRTAAPSAAPPADVPAPWGVVAADLGTQRLYRVHVRRSGDDASLRLVLRLAAEERFEVAASDAFGRLLWTLTVDDGRGRWSPGSESGACRFDPDRSLRLAEFDWDLPARDLAAALVGRVPEPPAQPGMEQSIDYTDGAGRRWSASRDGLGPLRWTLYRAGEPSLSWERADRGGRLTARGADLLIRWSEVAREPLAGEGPRLPAAAADPECKDAELS